jgi:hypothetical protein
VTITDLWTRIIPNGTEVERDKFGKGGWVGSARVIGWAVFVFLPLVGGKTALLLGTCSVPLALGWVLGHALTDTGAF